MNSRQFHATDLSSAMYREFGSTVNIAAANASRTAVQSFTKQKAVIHEVMESAPFTGHNEIFSWLQEGIRDIEAIIFGMPLNLIGWKDASQALGG